MKWFKRKQEKRIHDIIKKATDKLEVSRINGEYLGGEFESSEDAIEIQFNDIDFFPDTKFKFNDEKNLENEIFSICSFDLNHVQSDLKGKGHFIYVYREYGEYPSEKWFNEYCMDNVIAFKITDNVVNILADSKLFGCSPEHAEYKNEFISTYMNSKKKYGTSGIESFEYIKESRDVLRQLGSKPMWVQNNAKPKIEKIKFIAQLDPYKLEIKEPYLFLFYDESNEIFYQVEQYT